MAKAIKGNEAIPARSRLTPERIAGLLWDSALQAFIGTLMVQVLGAVVIDFLSSFCEDMFPTAPPILSPSLKATSLRTPAFLKTHGVVLVFLILFAVDVSRRLRILYRRKRGQLDHWLKAGARLQDQWFPLFIGNAIGAMVSVFVLYSVGQFAYTRILWEWLAGGVQPLVTKAGLALLGGNLMDTLQGLWAWYGENQIRFLFWFIYVSAICDDLGLPNLKTLAKRGWGKLRAKPLGMGPAATAPEEHPPAG